MTRDWFSTYPDLRALAQGGLPSENEAAPDAVAALQELAIAKQKQEFVNDTAVWVNIEPDWNVIASDSLEILRRSWDLRAGVRLAQAAASRSLPEFAAALGFIRLLVVEHWDQVHPAVEYDAQGHADAWDRVNNLRYLEDRSSTARLLRNLTLFTSRKLGRITLREIELCKDQLPRPDSETVLSMEELAEAFAGADPDHLRKLLDAVQAATAHAEAISEKLAEISRTYKDPDVALPLAPLREVLSHIDRNIREHAASVPEPPVDQGIGDMPDDPVSGNIPAGKNINGMTDGQDIDGMPGSQQTGGGLRGGAGQETEIAIMAINGTAGPVDRSDSQYMGTEGAEIRSRADVVMMIDRICAYYEAHEPSSPVPLLLQRARGLVDKRFIDILLELAPNGLPEATGILQSRADVGGGEETTSPDNER